MIFCSSPTRVRTPILRSCHTKIKKKPKSLTFLNNSTKPPYCVIRVGILLKNDENPIRNISDAFFFFFFCWENHRLLCKFVINTLNDDLDFKCTLRWDFIFHFELTRIIALMTIQPSFQPYIIIHNIARRINRMRAEFNKHSSHHFFSTLPQFSLQYLSENKPNPIKKFIRKKLRSIFFYCSFSVKIYFPPNFRTLLKSFPLCGPSHFLNITSLFS